MTQFSHELGKLLTIVSTPEERLRLRIRDKGPIPFSEFMEEALYGERGYYTGQDLRIGKSGDFVTGSSLSSLFGRATARLMLRMDRVMETEVDYLEAGYGTASHLSHIVDALGDSSRRRVLAWDRVPRPVPMGVERLHGLESLAGDRISGLVFSYEMFDALPIHRLVGSESGGVEELWVDVDGAEFIYRQGAISRPAVQAMVDDMDLALEPGQVADLSPDWGPLYRRLATTLDRGLLVTCDYGFERTKLLDPRIRSQGTLACYRSQQVHRDALLDVGRQDLTAHVDFTSLRREGERAGLETVALTRQASWLVACGIFEGLEQASRQERIDAMTLLDPSGMGEEIRVLVQSRGVASESFFEVALTGPHPSIQ